MTTGEKIKTYRKKKNDADRTGGSDRQHNGCNQPL